MSNNTDLCYPVLTPINLDGTVIKPPCLVQLSAEEAAPLIADGLIGADASPSPDAAAASAAGDSAPAAAAAPTVVKPAQTKAATKTANKTGNQNKG